MLDSIGIINPKSFTIEYKGLMNSLSTPCGICEAINPKESIMQFNALWDTGAEGSVISERVVQMLGLEPTGKARVHHANGESIVNTYSVYILLPNKVVFYIPMATEGVLTVTDVLIGMDIISRGDFTITAPENKTKLSFQIPSTHNTDYVKEFNQKLHTPIVKEPVLGRNNLCSCGSGKKYKHCCGF
ncbi:MAG: retroviral-like aspartic protease family protein [Fibromonadales bacterium]|nr:retroviral-like aspartic protease family protein [Fibromonadales bacterium]